MVLHHWGQQSWVTNFNSNKTTPILQALFQRSKKIPKFDTTLYTHGWKRSRKIVMLVRSHSLNWDRHSQCFVLAILSQGQVPICRQAPPEGVIMRLSANKPVPINPEPKGYKPGGNSNPSAFPLKTIVFFWWGGREAEVSTPQGHGSGHRCIQHCALATESPKQEGNHTAIPLGSLAPALLPPTSSALLSPTSSSSSKL